MTRLHADQIAYLLNLRNQLLTKYSGKKILECQKNYVYMQESDIVIACAEIKKVQWYQWEILHLSVQESFEGKGYGSKILKIAEDKILKGGAKILQCIIRNGNSNSERLFLRNGYVKSISFFNNNNGNTVSVYQKSNLQFLKS